MAQFDTIIRDGLIVDGTRMPRFRADIGIKDGKIAKIGRLAGDTAQRVIDAAGAIVAPGFIDLHTHYDAQLFWDPYCTISSWHGITTIVIGNCGFGFAPEHPEDRERAMLTMTRVEAIPYASMKAGLPWDWVTFPEFLDSIDRRPKGINILPYVPLAPLLTWVMGMEEAKKRKPTDAETREMCRLLNEAMDAGGCGFSAQRIHPDSGGAVQRDYDGTPMVTDVMHNDTAVALARVLGERNEGFIQMVYATGHPKSDFRHFEQLAEVSGRPILWNAISPDDTNPLRHRGPMKWIQQAQEKGLRIYGQGITTNAGLTFTFIDWNLFDDAQAWCDATTGTVPERKAKLADPARRPALIEQVPRQASNDLATIVVLETRREDLKKYENLTLGEIGAAQGGKHPVDVMLDLAVADDMQTEFFAPALNHGFEFREEIVRSPYVIPGVSDGGAHTKFFTGGRYGTEFLIDYVREHPIVSLEEAHWKLSALPAYCAGFADRGLLREGYAADVVIYDMDKLQILPAEVAHDFPANEWRRVQRAEGYRYVLLNGEVTFIDGQPTGIKSGKLLRHGAASPEPVRRAA
ncbi:MAG: N-acyl-D-amino-acid deacylase family protein [Candidatus Binataceae bacterium]